MATILIIGRNGLLGHALLKAAPFDILVVALSHAEFDLTRPEETKRHLENLRPESVINTAAYNQVDRCEDERERSWAINAEGPRRLAEACNAMGCRLVHFGSDYVFDGKKKTPYVETDAPDPLNHYGAGKLAGEQAVLEASADNLVLRTSWLFGSHPTQTKTYVHTVLRLAQAGQPLKATTDQVSCPTYVCDLAKWIFALLQQKARGLFHAVNDEPVSRYDWTKVIVREAVAKGLLDREIPIDPVTSDYFNARMRRPSYTPLDNRKLATELGIVPGSWRKGLSQMLDEMRRGEGGL